MRASDPTATQRTTHIEACEERLALTAQAVGELIHNGELEQETGYTADQLAQSLSSVHQGTGVSYARNTFGFDGEGQTIAVIDSGIAWDHYAFGGGFGAGHRVVGGWDFTEENDANPYDDGPAGFHGTHVAGIIGGDYGSFEGVAPGADLVALRVFNDQGVGQFDWVEDALEWVYENRNSFENPITTVNLSLGMHWNQNNVPYWSQLEDDFARLNNAGIFVSVSAGNSFQDFGTKGLSYPAASPYVVPVASVGADGKLSDFSQRHDRVIAAPGENIISSVPDHLFGADGYKNDYASASGTSMSAPYLAGASALIREAMWFNGISNVTQSDIYNHLVNTADNVYDPITKTTYKRLNVESALNSLMPGDDFGNTFATAGSWGTVQNGSSFSGTIGTLADVDYFTFTAAATGEMKFTASGTHDFQAAWKTNSGEVAGDKLSLQVVAGQTYSIGLRSTDGIGHYNINTQLTASIQPEVWGAVEQKSFQKSLSGEKWYQIEAVHTGLVTVQASIAAGDKVTVEVYNSQQELIATAARSNGVIRTDALAAQGEKLLIRVVGSRSAVDYTVSNLVEFDDDTVIVHGTKKADAFRFTAGQSQHRVIVNNLTYNFNAGASQQFHFDGKGGSDTLRVDGSTGDDHAVLGVRSAEVTADNYELQANNFETVQVFGRGGNDSAEFFDSTGHDRFYAKGNKAWMKGNGFANVVVDINNVSAHATTGKDRAFLYDTAGNDQFVAEGKSAALQSNGRNIVTNNFARVDAFSTLGGQDTATFLDTAGNDQYRGGAAGSNMRGSGYLNVARGNWACSAIASAGGKDSAILFDSAGDDLFVAHAGSAWIQGVGYLNTVSGFDRVDARSTAGGKDCAILYDSSGNDVLSSDSALSVLRGPGFYNIARGFGEVTAVAVFGGYDKASFNDSAGDDIFTVTPQQASMAGTGYTNKAQGFDAVSGIARFGGDDVSILYGSAGNDTLVSRDSRVWLTTTQHKAYTTGFENVYALGGGGEDIALYYDLTSSEGVLAGNNAFTAVRTDSRVQAYNFGSVLARAKNGETPYSELNAVDYLFTKQGW